MSLKVLLISTYEMGRQPFGLASPAAWLRQMGAEVSCLDLSIQSLSEDLVSAADLIAFYVPMHTATRMAIPLIERVQRLNPQAHLCCFGLYAPVNEAYLRRLGVRTILGGEFETGLVNLAKRLSQSPAGPAPPAKPLTQPEPLVSLERQNFLLPERTGLPRLNQYAQLVIGDEQRSVGYVEASRGCKHRCRHCPIVPVYGGHFRIVQPEVVLADIRQQVAAGARHITFGDPDFWNGPGHAMPLVTALHTEYPALTYDVTIKVEHLLKYRKHLKTLKETGCLFITTAVESFDERILTIFEKRHTRQDFETALQLCREPGLLLVPTFVAFTPWTTLAGYRAFLAEIARLGLVDQVAPIQYAIRLLIPPGSRLLELPQVQALIGELDQPKFSYPWRNPDERVDDLQKDLERLAQDSPAQNLSRREIFQKIWKRAHQDAARPPDIDIRSQLSSPAPPIPYLTEPWYC